MLKDSFKYRKKYYVTLFVSIYVIIFTICALVIAANWKYLKILFTPKEVEISLEQKQFDELFLKIKQLEDLSKEYDENNYQLRAVIYIRSAQYPDSEWGDILGENDEDFVDYVESKQGDKNISDLRVLTYVPNFTNPQTKQKVDFYKLFANINALMVQNQECIDFRIFGGYIGEVASSYINSSLTGAELRSNVEAIMTSNGSFGEYDRIPGYDAIGIYNELLNNDLVYDSIYLSSIMYYSSITKEKQIQNFKDFVNFENEGQELENEIYLRLQNNIYLQTKCDELGFDFPDLGEDEEESREAEIIKTVISVYVNILGV